MQARPLFFLVDDDPDDLMLLKDAIHSIDNTIRFAEAKDGRSALQYLTHITDPAQVPSLIILDINMPVVNGRDLLATIKVENSLKHIPVIVLTTSSYPGDIAFCRQFDVELITKPFGMKELLEISGKLIASYS
jgi:CheY-like chemotaxis protein